MSRRVVVSLCMLCGIFAGFSFNVFSQELPPPVKQGSDPVSNQELPSPESLAEKASFLIGYNLIKEFQAQDTKLDVQQLMNGILTASRGAPTGMSDEEINSVMATFEKRLIARQREKWEQAASENKVKGQEFLKANAEKEGVVVLETGLQYKVLKQGAGASPAADDGIKYHLKVSFTDGTTFVSTEGGKPHTGKVGSVPVRGIAQALQLMKVGSRWQLAVPSELAFGPNGTPEGIGPNQALLIEVELLEILQ